MKKEHPRLSVNFRTEYNSWHAMRHRCYNPNFPYYEAYGGAGITVCERWREKGTGFANFLEDMGSKPEKFMTLDRIDNSKGYSPENCRWATPTEQNNNKSNPQFRPRQSADQYRGNHKLLTAHGETKTLTEWSNELGISVNAIRARLNYGWSPERIIMKGDQRTLNGKWSKCNKLDWTKLYGDDHD